jgi:hypothetical protein
MLIKEKDNLLILQSQKIKENSDWADKVNRLEEHRLKEIDELKRNLERSN